VQLHFAKYVWQKRDSEQETPGVLPTSAVGAPAETSQAEGRHADLDEFEAVTVASLLKGKKKKAFKVVLPPRTNLRSTPARQAWALNLVQQ
jgi:hypothetical protein